MVAGKSILDKIESDHVECAIRNKIVTNLNKSQSSSSDESLKSKSDSEDHTDRSLGSSTKEETEEDLINLNSTYFCSKPNDSDDNVAEVKKSEESVDFLESKHGDQSVTWDISKRVLNFAKSFDISQWNSELCDMRIENMSLENSKYLTTEDSEKSLLLRMRNHLVEFQEARGTSREDYTYTTLIKFMGHATGCCLFALSYVLLNLIPILEIFLHVFRFVLDKLIDIKNSQDSQQMCIKAAIFSAQLLSIYVCLLFIFGFIVLPIVRMVFGIVTKILLYD